MVLFFSFSIFQFLNCIPKSFQCIFMTGAQNNSSNKTRESFRFKNNQIFLNILSCNYATLRIFNVFFLPNSQINNFVINWGAANSVTLGSLGPTFAWGINYTDAAPVIVFGGTAANAGSTPKTLPAIGALSKTGVQIVWPSTGNQGLAFWFAIGT